ncbi:TfoX/Sxy family protein [Leptospira sp. WS92.C1]
MSSDPGFVDFIVGQMENAGRITSKKMFGEYAIYCEGKIVALICDNRLFIKPTGGGKKWIGNIQEASAYPGAKPSFWIPNQFENKEWISALIRITAAELPEPKPKSKSKKKGLSSHEKSKKRKSI